MTNIRKQFKQLVHEEQPLLIVGVINAFCAILAEKADCKAIYLSGAGVANASYGLPDLGMTSLTEVVTEVDRITQAVDVPLLVDADTGWGDSLNVARTVQQLSRHGAAAIHLEDQQWPKRCGHREGKVLIEQKAMCDKIKAAVDARVDAQFVIMARTDALAVEGQNKAIERAVAYRDAGADMIFVEAVTAIEQYSLFKNALGNTPILANITEFGKTPLFDAATLAKAGVDMMLFPLTAFRAMSQTALSVYQAIQAKGTQQDLIKQLQTRDELYKLLNYESFEARVDQKT